MKVYGLPEGQGLDRWNRRRGPYYSGGPDPSPTFIVPEAKVSIAFSALNNCSVITR